MDKMKGLAKGGWHPAGDRQISRDSWKSDLKGIATGKKKDPYEDARNHESKPLASLRDPDSFGPPPKHKEFYGANGTALTPVAASSSSVGTASIGGPTGGWGSSAVEPGYAQRKREQEEEEGRRMEAGRTTEKTSQGPWMVDGSGLRTDNLPKPPVRRNTPDVSSANPTDQSSSVVPPRQPTGPAPGLPPRAPPRQTTVNTGAPPPTLPPRQNEYPDEYTPPPPPTYHEALRSPETINKSAAQRLGQAGVSVAGFGIGGNGNGNNSAINSPESPVRGHHIGQLSELQQRFAKMNTGAASEASESGRLAEIAQKKAPPPPPPKKVVLSSSSSQQISGLTIGSSQSFAAPPPVPTDSKPKPI